MGAPRLLAPTTISGGIPVSGAGAPNTVALWQPDGVTLGNSLLTQAGSIITNATGAIRATGTSQVSPAFMRHDATNTGIYFPGLNEIGLTINGQHAMFIGSTRSVGIGTVTPSSALQVRSNSAPGITLDSTLGGGRQYLIAPIRTGLSNAGFEIRDVTAGAAVMSFDASQFVGIGTASPTQKLDVRGASAFLNAGTDGVYGDIAFIGSSSYPTTYLHKIKASVSNTTTNALLTFALNSGVSSFTDVMTLRGDGHVGIGTASPGAQLQVERAGGTSNAEYLRLRNTSSGTGSAVGIDQYVSANTVATGRIQHAWNGTTYDTIFSNWNGSALAEAVRIQGGGNVGIGTASPSSLGANYTTLDIRGSSGGGIRMGTPSIMSYMYADSSGYNLATATALPIIAYTNNVERMRIASTGAAADSQVAIGTSSFATFTGGGVASLTTNRDVSVNGVRVGIGGGANTTNTVVGAGGLAAGAGAFRCVAVGQSALAAVTSGNSNTAVGAQALVTNQTGNENVAVGSFALQLATADKNIGIGHNAAANLTTGTSNIVIGITAPSPAVGTSNMLALGSSTNWVATNGAAATYYNTATALSTGTLPATCGFIRVYLNGSWVKIPVYAD
jgi:hypothetical protein